MKINFSSGGNDILSKEEGEKDVGEDKIKSGE